MKVLHLLDSLNRGGAETLALDVCRNARRFGIDLTLAAAGGGDLFEDFANSGAEFIPMRRDLPVDPNLAWQLRKILREKQIEIVQSYQPVETLHLFLAALGLEGVKIVQSHQGFIRGNKNILTAKFLSPKIDANIACSRALFSWLRKEVGIDTSEKFYLIYNGIDQQRLISGRKDLKEELGFDPSSPLLGMVANFRPDLTKDQMTVCRSLPEVFEKFQNANFVFIGKISEGGEDNFERCVRFCDENGIGEKVFFLGGRNDVGEILSSLDLFVFSSLNEGLPLSVAEAMLARVPVAVSDIPTLREAADQGRCAQMFEPKNAEDLAEKIIRLLEDKTLRENLTDRAFEHARRNFTIEAHLRGLKTLYEELSKIKIENGPVDDDSVLKLN